MGITRQRPADAADYAATESTAPAAAEGFEPDEYKPAVSGGWGAAKKVMASTSTFSESFKFPNKDKGEESALIKIPEDAPFASYAQHWVDEISSGKKSWTCLEKVCALCARGHKPRGIFVFNVIDALTGEVKPLEAGPMLAKILETENDGRSGPLSRGYWEVYCTGGGNKGKMVYTVKPVKARDLQDDFGLDPDEVAASLAGVTLLDQSWVTFPKVETLRELAEEHLTN